MICDEIIGVFVAASYTMFSLVLPLYYNQDTVFSTFRKFQPFHPSLSFIFLYAVTDKSWQVKEQKKQKEKKKG